jgi:adenylate cyclase
VTEPVALEDILPCLQGGVPSPFATCSADGTPNVTYLSIVQYVDAERVAISRQFLNKSRANLDANPFAQVLVAHPVTQQQYVLDLCYLHTETEGEVFATMRANLDAIAAHEGMGSVFRLRGVDVHRVTRCAPFGTTQPTGPASATRDLLDPLDRFVRRLGACATYEETASVALEALDDLFGVRHAILLAADTSSGRLFAVASSGYPASAVGAEVEQGEGLIGTAAARRRVVVVANLARSRTMASAVLGRSASDAREVPLPGLQTARSAAAVPLVLAGDVLGVLYLESEEPAAFGGPVERALRIVGAHLAAALAARSPAAADEQPSPTPLDRVPAAGGGAPLAVVYYQADDSVLCDGEYVVKGVPGRILWKLVREHAATGRTQFTNRELRLDETLGLPAGNDNLEARLLVLRRRLGERSCGITLERVGRGRLELGVERPTELTEVSTSGPMRAFHASR